MNTFLDLTKAPTQEAVLMEMAVACSLMEKYGTNQPGKTYEDGVVDALLWIMGGKQPQLVEDQNSRQPIIDWPKAPAGCGLYYIRPDGCGFWALGWTLDFRGVGGVHPPEETGIYSKPCSGAVVGDANYTEMLVAGVFPIGGIKA